MGEVLAASTAAVLLVPVALGATVLGLIFSKRDASSVLPIICNFNQGNFTAADMRVLQNMTFRSVHGNGSGVMTSPGSLAHFNLTTPQWYENGIASGSISLFLDTRGLFSEGKGSYIIVDRSENSRANYNTISAFDIISRAIADTNVDISLQRLTTVVDFIEWMAE